MKKWRLKRYLSLVLVLVLLVNMYPIQSLASVSSGDAAVAPVGTQSSATVSSGDAYVGETDLSGDGLAETTVTDSVGGRSVVSVMYEVEELREEDTKHFRLSDGSFVAVAYGVPVHYQDEEGQWQDIDNSLVVTADDTNVSTFRNAAGDNEVSFAATLGIGKLFTAAYEDVAVSMSLLDTAQADAQVETEVPSLFAMEEVHSWDVEDVIPKNLQSTLLYEDVFPGIDLQYTAYSYNIKEQVIVNELQEAYLRQLRWSQK